MGNDQLINQTSGKTNWFTPAYIIEAARRAMGGIDLDPASCEEANRTVGAASFYTAADDGLSLPWHGNVWLNYPYSRRGNQEWTAKAIYEYRDGTIEAACILCFAATSERWFQPLLGYPVCFLAKRVAFIDGDTLKPVRGGTKGSAVVYLGSNVNRFVLAFQPYGKVLVPYV